jgi:hypothetical protein
MGQKQTPERVQSMSALPPKADIVEHRGNVRFVPKADIQPKERDVRRIAFSKAQDYSIISSAHSAVQ